MAEPVADESLAAHWLDALGRPGVAEGLEAIYADAATAIAARGPACWASGRCCRFEAHGHRLYVTGLEAAYVALRLPDIAGTRPGNHAEPTLRPLALEQARAAGGCPFQSGHLCGVHAIKPLGCRVYFCDRTAQAWQQDLSETLLARLRALHDEHAIEYRYAEWRAMLARFVDAGP
jgi:Fe-S-cluster containining protein